MPTNPTKSGAPATNNSDNQPPEYETAKGCLMLSIGVLICLALFIAMALLFGDSAV